jgi:DNA transposition AAA+ family ATPase
MMNEKSVQKGLEQDAEIIRERMPKEMSKINARQKAESLQRFMEKHGYSQGKIAKLLGVSSTQISQFLNNKYPGDVETLVNKVVDLINTVGRRQKRLRHKPFVETRVARKIGTLIKQTRAFTTGEEGAIAIVIGDSGHGKSICLRQYAEANKNTMYILLDDAMNSTRVFSEIARKLGIDASGSMDNITRRIIGALQNREIVIMIDEASGLKVKQLSQLRTVLVDQCRCPLVLAGNSDLLKTVMQPKTRRGHESLDQFRSRLTYILNLDELAARKGSGLYTAEDIRKLYEYGGLRLTSDAAGVLRNIGRTPQSGRLRTCSRIITALHVAHMAGKIGELIDAALILEVIEELGLPVKVYLPVAAKETDEEQTGKPAAMKAG